MEIQEINNLLTQCQELEVQLVELKEIEKKQKELKEKLLEAMINNEVDKWQTPNGIKITLVKGYLPSERKVMRFDEKAFKDENEELYNKYLFQTTEKDNGRKDYVKITYGAKND